jgi:hypothetical protein
MINSTTDPDAVKITPKTRKDSLMALSFLPLNYFNNEAVVEKSDDILNRTLRYSQDCQRSHDLAGLDLCRFS